MICMLVVIYVNALIILKYLKIVLDLAILKEKSANKHNNNNNNNRVEL